MSRACHARPSGQQTKRWAHHLCRSARSTAGSLQSLCWASSAVGAILSAYFSGSLVESNGSRFVFTLTALFPLIVASSAFLIDEEPAAEHSRREGDKGEVQEWDNRRAGEGRGAAVGETGRVQGGAGAVLGGEVDGGSLAAAQKPGWFVTAGENASTLWKALREKGILLPAVFLFMWQATPSASSGAMHASDSDRCVLGVGESRTWAGRGARLSAHAPLYAPECAVPAAMFYFYTGELGFTPEFLGRVALVGAVSHLAGIGVYNKVRPLLRLAPDSWSSSSTRATA